MSNQLKSFSSGTANQTNRHKFVMCKTMSDKQSFKGNFANYIHFAKNSAYNIEIHVFSTLSGWREELYLRQLINMIFFMTCEHHTMSLTVFCGISKKRWHGRHYREPLVGKTMACVVPMVFLFSRCCFHFYGDQISGFSKQCGAILRQMWSSV